MLPPLLNLVLEIEFTPADAVRGGQNSSVDFSIQNVRFWPRKSRKLQQSASERRSLVFSYPTVHTHVTSVPADSTEFNVMVARAYSKQLGAFVTFRANAAPEGVTDLEHPGTQADGISFLESQMQSRSNIQIILKDFAEHHHFLQAMAGTYDSTFRNMRLNKNIRAKLLHSSLSSGARAAPPSGISTRAGDLARFSASWRRF